MVAQNVQVCITGANGFIGKELVNKLISQGYKVRVLSRKKGKYFSEEVEIVVGDLTNKEYDLKEFLNGCNILFHCAGEIHRAELMEPLHVQGTKKLIQAVISDDSIDKSNMHWVQLSSCGAYGPPANPENERTVTEDSATNPDNEYEVTKTRSDELLISLAQESGISFSILRPSNVFGASMIDNSLRRLINMVKRQRFFYLGKPGAVTTYIHVSDVVNALITLATDTRAKGETFNLSCDCTMEDLVNEIALRVNVSAPSLRLPSKLIRWPLCTMSFIFKRWLHVPTLAALVTRTHYPANKIVDKLEFKFSKPLPASIADMINNND